MDAEEMRELFNDGVQTMRMNYYPCCPEPDKTIGITPHSDADALNGCFSAQWNWRPPDQEGREMGSC